MPSRTGWIVIAALGFALAGLLTFAGYGWLGEHDARLKAQTQTGQQQAQIDVLNKQRADAQRALTGKLAAIEQARSRTASAGQIVAEESSLIPDLPDPLVTKTVPVNAALPDGPSTQQIVIPEADFKSFRDAQLNCEESSVRLSACSASEGDLRQQLKLTGAQRDEWKTAAKGGAVWHRALGAAKWFAAGAATGAAAYAITHHK